MATAQTIVEPQRVAATEPRRTTLADGFRLAAAGLTALVALTALWVLAGWTFGMPSWRSVFPGSVSMTPNIAVGLLLAAGGLWIYQRPVERLA